MLSELIQYGLLFAASAQAASINRPAAPCHHHDMAAFYDGGSLPAATQEQPHDEAKPPTHSEAVMAELKRLGDANREMHINHSDFPTKDVVATEQPITITTSNSDEQQRQQFYSFEHDHPVAVDHEQVPPPAEPHEQLKRSPQFPDPPCCKQDPVAVYGQCGGQDYVGAHFCEFGAYCQYQDQYYSQCLPGSNPPGYVEKYGQCGGENYTGNTYCQPDTTCVYQNPFYSQCL